MYRPRICAHRVSSARSACARHTGKSDPQHDRTSFHSFRSRLQQEKKKSSNSQAERQLEKVNCPPTSITGIGCKRCKPLTALDRIERVLDSNRSNGTTNRFTSISIADGRRAYCCTSPKMSTILRTLRNLRRIGIKVCRRFGFVCVGIRELIFISPQDYGHQMQVRNSRDILTGEERRSIMFG